MHQLSKQISPFFKQIQRSFLGIIICSIITCLALGINHYMAAPVMFIALFLGICLQKLYQHESVQAGILFCSGTVLKLGVALLGFRISFLDINTLNGVILVGILSIMLLTMLSTIYIAKKLNFPQHFGVIAGAAVSICGASAALAATASLPKHPRKEQDSLLIILCVTTLSTISMLTYPVIADMLNLSDQQAGLFLGGAIHDVAQVVGASYSINEATGIQATLVKMIRVAMLFPIMLMIAAHFKTQASEETPKMPIFLIAFCVFITLNNVIYLPEELRHALEAVSSFCLITALAALGMKSNVELLNRLDIKTFILILSSTLIIASLMLLLSIFAA